MSNKDCQDQNILEDGADIKKIIDFTTIINNELESYKKTLEHFLCLHSNYPLEDACDDEIKNLKRALGTSINSISPSSTSL